MAALTPVPPFGILEPRREYADGTPRQDGGWVGGAHQARLRAAVWGSLTTHSPLPLSGWPSHPAAPLRMHMRGPCAVLEARVALDILIMPGLAFDAQGRRLGRGGG
jgi:hypothetical protein